MARTRKLHSLMNQIKGKQGKASMFQAVGKEVGDMVGAIGTLNAENLSDNKNFEAGALEASVTLEKKNLGIWNSSRPSETTGFNKDFFKNWKNELGFTGPENREYTSAKGDRTYSSSELTTLGMLKNAKSDNAKFTLAQMQSGDKPLSSYFGKDTKKSSFDNVNMPKTEEVSRNKMAQLGDKTYKAKFGLELPSNGNIENKNNNLQLPKQPTMTQSFEKMNNSNPKMETSNKAPTTDDSAMAYTGPEAEQSPFKHKWQQGNDFEDNFWMN